MRAVLLITIPLLALGACNTVPQLAGGAGKDSVATLIRQYQDQAKAAAQASTAKDSVIAELATATKLMDQLGDLEKDIGIRSKSKGEPVEKWDVQAERRLKEIRARFRVINGRLARLRKLVPENKALQEQINSLTALVDQKQARITELEGQLAAAQQENTRLTNLAAAQTDTINNLVTQDSKVYWIAGEKSALLKDGVVREVGGSRILLVTRIGESLAPSRTLDASQFKEADMRTLKEIQLDGRYQVVTPQDLKYVASSSMDANHRYVQGNLDITSNRFWDNSHYLILVKK